MSVTVHKVPICIVQITFSDGSVLYHAESRVEWDQSKNSDDAIKNFLLF